MDISIKDRFLGCLLGGAVGDALGAPVEFLSRAEIIRRFGPHGITQYAPAYGGLGKITDDTQMTLFTAEGLLRGWVRGNRKGITSYTGTTALAYKRWLYTQGERQIAESGDDESGWLFLQNQLHSCRAPGLTCLGALKKMSLGTGPAVNDSKGCGGVMRMAPVGLFYGRLQRADGLEEAFRLGTELAALTHGHPSGSLAAGALAAIVLILVAGRPLEDALAATEEVLATKPYHQETLQALRLAKELASSALKYDEAITKLGLGWVAEEALAIAVYCALVAKNYEQGIILAVNHDGDSDSTGAIAGNILGAMLGIEAISSSWLERLELRDVISEVAIDLYEFIDWEIGDFNKESELTRKILDKYPGY